MSTPFAAPPESPRLPDPYRAESGVVQGLAERVGAALDWPGVIAMAGPWVAQVRKNPAPFWAMESLLREYPITSAEGLALMRLAEALLRVPDAPTAIALTADQLGRADFDGASAGSPHKMLAALSASAISMSKRFLPGADNEGGVLKRLGAQTVVAATVRAIQLLGRQFVLGQSTSPRRMERGPMTPAHRPAATALQLRHAGRGRAHRKPDAQPLPGSPTVDAIAGHRRDRRGAAPARRPTTASRSSCQRAVPAAMRCSQRDARLRRTAAARAGQLIDDWRRRPTSTSRSTPKRVDRLELSLERDRRTAAAPHRQARHPHWRGFGLADPGLPDPRARGVRATRSRINRPQAHGLRFMVRLVKGAYWDGEIKRAQELGLAAYPVFTHKHHTDISYLACAKRAARPRRRHLPAVRHPQRRHHRRHRADGAGAPPAPPSSCRDCTAWGRGSTARCRGSPLRVNWRPLPPLQRGA